MSKKFESYSDFTLWLDEQVNVEYVLDYGDWFVVKTEDGQYFYYEAEGEGESDTYCEMELVATLSYDSLHDIKLGKGETLDELFDNIVCGECVTDDAIYYLWFDEKKEV